MTTEDAAGLLIVGSFAALMLLEWALPARRYPGRRLWRARGVGFLLIMAALATFVPLLLPQDWLAQHRLLDGTALGVGVGAAVGFVVVSAVNYVWHRALHRYDCLWRSLHQMHHAPQRLDVASSTLFHPLDITMFVLWGTLTNTLVLGLTPEAAAIAGFGLQFYSFFQHMNVRTPRWLGYVIQRPEAHFVHHSRDVHAYNYGDFPLWDILLGTFRNPVGFGSGEVGFGEPADGRYLAMLVGSDVGDRVGTRVQKSGPGAAPGVRAA